MKLLKYGLFLVFWGTFLQVSAQETDAQNSEIDSNIENFILPSFSKLSNDIADNYARLQASLPDLSKIGFYIDQEIRRAFIDETNTVFTVRNFASGNSLLPDISPKRFQLRNSLNTIMFTGFDIGQLHMNEAYKN